MRVFISDSLADRRFIMTLLASTAVLALLMAAAGVYGVVSYIASRRTWEISVRIALGASRGKIYLLIFRQGFGTVILGLVIGIGLTAALLRIFQGIIAGLGSSDRAMFAISVGLVSVSAAIACWVPAYRAAKVDPMVALR